MNLTRDRLNRLFVTITRLICIGCLLVLTLQIAGIVQVTTQSITAPAAD